MRKILVPTDFSTNAFKAFTYAAEIAKVSRATIHLVHVIEPTLNMASMQTDSSNRKIIKDRSEKLSQIIKAAGEIYPDVKIIPWLSGGKVIDSLLGYAEEKKPDLIIMGTKGAGRLKKYFIGTITAGMISKTPIPVISVPASFDIHEPDVVLFATNRFEKNRKLLNKILMVPKLFSSEIHIIIFKEKNGDRNAGLIYNEEQLSDYLRFLRETFPKLRFKGALLEGEDFELTTDKYCNENNIELMAMVTYPKSFFERVFQRSVTKKMALYSTRPILAVPAIPENNNKS